jgi:hypothetical protein
MKCKKKRPQKGKKENVPQSEQARKKEKKMSIIRL